MGIPENVGALLVKFDINQEALANIAGVSPSTVTRWRNGAKPREDAIKAITEHFNISRDDLISDSYGLAEKEHSGVAKIERIDLEDESGCIRILLDEINRGVVGESEAFEMLEEDLKDSEKLWIRTTRNTAKRIFDIQHNDKASEHKYAFVSVPLYGSIAAGKPIEMQEVDDTHPVPAAMHERYPDAFLLRVEGESMNHVLPNGCYALIDPRDNVDHDGKPYAVCVNGYDATIKRVRKLNNGFQLVPDSDDPTYRTQTFDYNEPETETITVIGEVVYYVLPYDWGF